MVWIQLQSLGIAMPILTVIEPLEVIVVVMRSCRAWEKYVLTIADGNIIVYK